MRLVARDRVLSLAQPAVMGVVNVTPDSFSDGGRFRSPADAAARIERVVEEGAAIVDIGGESTRPGAAPVSEAEELDRVMPAIEHAVRFPALVSIDTSKPAVMRDACRAGAHLINDVRAFTAPGALEAAAETGAAVCLMHMRGEPATMQDAPHYGDVVAEVSTFLAARVAACGRAGIARDRCVIDPGFGFGKALEHNRALLDRLETFAGTGLPVLVGLSRKSFVAGLTGSSAGDRLAGSLALAVIAVLHGACIVRAHDVAATVEALRVAAAFRQGD